MNTRDAAARWFARVQSGEMNRTERDAFDAWRADEANDLEYRTLEHVWDAAARVAEDRLLALAREKPRRAVRWQQAGLAVACLLLLGVGIAAWRWQEAQPLFTAALETVRGERKGIRLPDGSALDANTQTRIQVAYYRDRRAVVLAEGEASFTVMPDAARPFVVDAGKGSVRVTSTRFNVRRDGDQVAVTVLSGTVEVTGALDPAAPVRLVAGQGARIDPSGNVEDARRVDAAALAAWREGRIVFDDAPLSEVVRELARYDARSVRLAGSEVGQLRLSSTFRVNDTDALLAALPKILPVRVRVLPDGGAEIYRP